MESIYKPLDYEVLRDVYGDEFANALAYLGVKNIIDPNVFVARRNYYPAIASIFVLGAGSFVHEYEGIGTVSTYNGTLQHLDLFDEIPFGDEYYYSKYNEELQTED